MRALFTCLPGYGSFYPMVPFARALQEAGHTVAFASSADFLPVIERCGFDGLAGGVNPRFDERLAEQQATIQSLSTAFERTLYIYTEMFRNHRPRYMIPDLLEICRSWRPDIIIREFIEFGGCSVAEMLDLPHAMVGAMEFYPTHLERAFQPALDLLRESVGLPPDPEDLMSHRYLTITGLPPEWVGEAEICPPTTHFVQPVQFDNIDGVEVPDWITDLPDQPTVHASMGTLFNRVPGNYEAILDGLGDEPINLIVAIGPDRDAEDFGEQPENVRLVSYLPHSLLLPHCDAVVSHAGYGVSMACLLNGLPSVMLPIDGDQPRNAKRVEQLGAGIMLPGPSRSADMVRDAVYAVLADERYRGSARRIRERLENLPGLDHAVHLIERLAEEKRPIVRAGRS